MSIDIQAFAKGNNCIIGICDASPLDPSHLQKSEFVPFVSKSIVKRTDPSAILPEVQSVFVFGVAAKQEKQGGGKQGDGSLASPPPCFSHLSSLGTDSDYHINVKTVIDKFVHEINETNIIYKVLVDSPNLDERAFAHRAGIGFFGRNGLIISPEFGTRFNIGLLLTNIKHQYINKTAPSTLCCPSNCTLCITACPTNAMQPNKPLNTSRCISYLTQKKELTAEEEKLLSLSNQLYGCDVCQDVCPFNTPHKKAYATPQEWLEMDDATFASKYGHTTMLWQGTALLRRNAKVVSS